MTRRTKETPNSPIERATQAVETDLSAAIHEECKSHRLDTTNPPFTEKEFRRLLVMYFHDKSLTDWAETLQINPDQFDEGNQ